MLKILKILKNKRKYIEVTDFNIVDLVMSKRIKPYLVYYDKKIIFRFLRTHKIVLVLKNRIRYCREIEV
jgi:hypothetical protein